MPEKSKASPKTTRYTSLKSKPGTKSNVSDQRSAKNVERGFSAEDTCGHVFQSVKNSAVTPNKQKIMLKAYADRCFRRTCPITDSHSASALLVLLDL
jgi:hypothetical protein